MEIRSLEEFELFEVRGVGTVGTVYRARDRETDQIVAIKILLPSVSVDPTVRARFIREMLVLQKLCHPNIVACYGGGEEAGQLFFAMEYLDGESMEEVLADGGRLPWVDVVECGWHICSALQYAHNQGIIHRDLKPSNIFFSGEGFLKLCDFGIALDTGESDLTEVGLTVGTHRYMAPELIRGEVASPPTDLYALGCVLYRMLVGRPPFDGRNFAAIFEQHLHQVPESLQSQIGDAPEELDQLVQQLLAKECGERPLNARVVQGQLAEIYLAYRERYPLASSWDPQRSASSAPNELFSRLRTRVVLPTAEVSPQRVSGRGLLWIGALLAGLALLSWVVA
jgi:serine/threonine protein kinase